MKVLKFTESTTPITEPVTKFGGQPVWISDPQWPLSRSTNKPMRFICQIALRPELQVSDQQMAYIFMTQGDEYIDDTWEPEGGENAIILQPQPFDPVCKTEALSNGPTLERRVSGPRSRMDRFLKRSQSWTEDIEIIGHEVEAPDTDAFGTKLEGEPDWLHNDETPDGIWLFLAQIDSDPMLNINFGDAGVAYAFIRSDGHAARFLWQCC